ncbi:MAG: hypothetical protein MJY56_00965 [Bacteroidales bacterium]|nr:hypothetical protein [Bacteroidales bacterium]
MNKFFKIAAVAAAALCFSSCMLSGLVKSSKKVIDEGIEIAKGNMFTIEEGTVTYDDGSILTFKKFGRNWASIDVEDGERSATIVTDDYVYDIDLATGEYEESAAGEYFFDLCPYVFWEALYEFGDDVNPAGVKKSDMTIAGKTCKVFDVDGDLIGGWCRIVFLTSEYQAVTWSENAFEAMFTVEGLLDVASK